MSENPHKGPPPDQPGSDGAGEDAIARGRGFVIGGRETASQPNAGAGRTLMQVPVESVQALIAARMAKMEAERRLSPAPQPPVVVISRPATPVPPAPEPQTVARTTIPRAAVPVQEVPSSEVQVVRRSTPTPPPPSSVVVVSPSSSQRTMSPVPGEPAAARSTAASGVPRLLRRQRPVIASKPRIELIEQALSEEPDERLSVLIAGVSQQAAAWRALRQSLIDAGDPRVVGVTSAQEKEGKTTCAANLALVLAEPGNARVLLIEANPDRPVLRTMFDIGDQAPCFLDQLELHRKQPDGPWTNVEIGRTGLHVLAAKKPTGQLRGRPIHGPTFSTAVDHLLSIYDYIVVDTPAVLASPAVTLVEGALDAVLVVARARASRGRQVRRAIDQLPRARTLGLVVVDDD